MPLLHLITAHFLADFVFQPDRLIRWKMRSGYGIFFHACLHAVVTGIIMAPYLRSLSAWSALGVILMLHFFIDNAKISMELKSDKHLFPFVVDQFLHLIVLSGVAGMFPVDLNVYRNPHIFFFIILAIFCTYAYEIYRYQRLREKTAAKKLKFPYDRMIERILLLALLYAAFLFAGLRVLSGP